MYCRNCGTKIEDGTKFCPSCGNPQYDETPATTICKHCGAEIDSDCIVCPSCGKQVKLLKYEQPNVVINNINGASVNTGNTKLCKKWVAFFLCLILGWLGGHKFYEGKIGMGILYMFTGGLFAIGIIVDLITILGKPEEYYA